MVFYASQQFSYHPEEGMTPQHPAATDPWTNPPTSNSYPQQTNAWNPWTNGPVTAPSSHTSHHYVYQPVSSSDPGPCQPPAARNPWTHPPAPTPSVSSSSNWSHQAVYNPSSAGSVRSYHQPTARNLWTDPQSLNLFLHVFRHVLLRICSHRVKIFE